MVEKWTFAGRGLGQVCCLWEPAENLPGSTAPPNRWARVLDKLAPGEQDAFLRAMDLLETGLRHEDTRG